MFDKFRMTFGTGHLYFSVSFWNTDLLFTRRAGINAESLPLLSQIFLTAEKVAYILGFGEKPLILLISLRIVSGKHPKINPDHSGGNQKI